MTGYVRLSAFQSRLLYFETTPNMSSTLKRHRHFIPNFEARSVLLVAALTLGGAAGAQGQTTPPSPSTSPSTSPAPSAPAAADGMPANKASAADVDAAFDRADTNKDGKLSRTEAENLPAVAQRFEQIDTDRDTFISREELTKFIGN